MDCSGYISDKVKLIDHVHKSLPLILLKAARQAEIKCGLRTSNGIVKRRLISSCSEESQEIFSIISDLRRLHNDESLSKNEQVIKLRLRLRFLQRRFNFYVIEVIPILLINYFMMTGLRSRKGCDLLEKCQVNVLQW